MRRRGGNRLRIRVRRKEEEETSEEEDGAGGFTEITMQAPAEGFALFFFAAQYAEQDVVHHVRENDGRAEEEDGQEPGVAEVWDEPQQVDVGCRNVGGDEAIQCCSVSFVG